MYAMLGLSSANKCSFYHVKFAFVRAWNKNETEKNTEHLYVLDTEED